MEYKKVDNWYITAQEEKLLTHIIPDYHLGKFLNQKKHTAHDIDYARNGIQNELSALLNSFVNGGFSKTGFLMYPLISDVSAENRERLLRIRKLVTFLENHGHSFPKTIALYRQGFSSRNVARIMGALYHEFFKSPQARLPTQTKKSCPQFHAEEYPADDKKYLRPLFDLKNYARKNLRELLFGFYLQGSLATKDYIKGWSDLDTVGIIARETIADEKKLLMLRTRVYHLRRFFYRIDPLQHHGCIFFTEYDSDAYCQAYFPFPLFSYAKSFFTDDKPLHVSIRPWQVEAHRKLFWFVNYFRTRAHEKAVNRGSYELKTLLHGITLFPALYLQARGIIVYKKFSFDIARKDFDAKTWQVMDTVSNIRRQWVAPPYDFGAGYAYLNPTAAYQLHAKIIDRISPVTKKNIPNLPAIISDMYALSESAWSRIKNEYYP